MDNETLAAYDQLAADFAADWEAQPAPADLHSAVRRFFTPGPTADVGCGSGRDTAWLNNNGFHACGFDASEGLLDEARKRHPNIRFIRAALPDLAGIEENSFANVLCETVIMHLAPSAIVPSVKRLLAILAPGGVLYLSWRVTEREHKRDGHGRLYAAFDPVRVLNALTPSQVLLDEQCARLSSGKLIRRIVARKAQAQDSLIKNR